jgi:hypothetical protein
MAQRKSVFRLAPDESVSAAVIRAVATVKDIDPIDLDERLYDHVDPCALNRLFRTDRQDRARGMLVSFTMAGCHIQVQDGQKVVVTADSDRAVVCDEAV